MKALIISLSRIESSAISSQKVYAQLKDYGFDAELFEGTYGNEVEEIFLKENRKLSDISFKGVSTDPRYIAKCNRLGVKGCFHSHYRAWEFCLDYGKPVYIFEDDVIFYRNYIPVEWEDILMLATGKNLFEDDYFRRIILEPEGDPRAIPLHKSSMPGTVGYGIKPEAAKKLVERWRTDFLPSDNALNTQVVKLEYHSHLMGRGAVGVDGKKSLTKSAVWNKKVTTVAS